MNRMVAHKLLTRYVELVDQASSASMWTKERKAAREAANDLLPMINKLLRSLAPDMETISASTVGSHVAALPTLDRAWELLEAWEQLDKHERTGGGPAFPLSLLDPVISEVATRSGTQRNSGRPSTMRRRALTGSPRIRSDATTSRTRP
jgi:hypothetical protein